MDNVLCSEDKLLAKDVLRLSPDADMPFCIYHLQPWQLTALCSNLGVNLCCYQASPKKVHAQLANTNTAMTVKMQYNGDTYTVLQT